MTELSYGVLLDRLFPRLTGGVRWGLDRTLRLLVSAGQPHTTYPSIHIGGTNGKGSVAAVIESVLRQHGFRTGLYTSPHLVDFRERIRIDGRPIAEHELVAVAGELWGDIEREAPSFFEATTVLAFAAFRRADVDVAVLEVGMGGRLDSTNVVRPEVTAITNVARDHAEFLGAELRTIAREKAGIIKEGVPLVTAEADPAVLRLLRDRAAEVGAPVHVVGRDQVVVGPDGTSVKISGRWGDLELQPPLRGRHQALNLAVALRCLELLPDSLRPSADAVARGVPATRWPGRLQIERLGGVTWLFDVAHNPAGVASLIEALPDFELPRPVTALVGVLADKDCEGMLGPMIGAVDQVLLCEPPSAPEGRRWDPESVLGRLGSPAHARVVRPFDAAVAAASAAGAGGTVVCTGSVHTVGDAMLTLGIPPFGDDTGLQPGPAGG